MLVLVGGQLHLVCDRPDLCLYKTVNLDPYGILI